MKTILHQPLSLLLVAASMSLGACNSIVHDDMTECPEGIVIQLVPKYAARTSFEAELTDAHVAIYNADTNAKVKDLELNGTELAQSDYSVNVSVPEGKYRVVVWNGLCDTNNYASANDSVTLRVDNLNTTNSEFAPLWHGEVANVNVEALTMAKAEVPMVKDTNNFVIYLCTTTGEELNPDEFEFKITSSNGKYDSSNNVLTGPEITYGAFSVKSEAIEGSIEPEIVSEDDMDMLPMVRGDINTLRLTTEHPSYLQVSYKDSGKNIIALNLNDYVLKAYRSISSAANVPSQQYFDTEDLFNVTIFLSPRNNNSGTDPGSSLLDDEDLYYVSALRINYWILRLQEAELF
jgi:hypothetical protein